MKRTATRQTAIQNEALTRAISSQALTNLPAIYHEFMDRGIPETEIKPRENVFTFHAWRALGRTVRRGEHGVRIITWIPIPGKMNDDGTVKYEASKRPRTAVVFHVSQTDPLESRA